MNFTETQRKVLKYCRMSKVIFRPMYVKNKELGYAARGSNYSYDINIASDVPTDIKKITLVHEAGHIYLRHTEVCIKKEVEVMYDLIKKYNTSVEHFLNAYGGFTRFLNICMDLEINSKFLTYANVNTMQKFGFNLCTPTSFEVDYQEEFNNYYEPLISKLPKKNESEQKNKIDYDMSQDIPNLSDLMGDLMDLPEELQKTIMEEDYTSGNEKSSTQNNKGECTLEEALASDDKISKNGNSNEQSTSSTTAYNNRQIYLDEDIVAIKKMLLSIVNDVDISRKQDNIRIYNRGTRGRNALYTSRKYNPNICTPRLGIVVDISGSMDNSKLLQAVASLKNVSSKLHKDSVLLTCNTEVKDIFNIREIPEAIEVGGGTSIDKGVKYLVDNKFTDIVVYSDFYTDMRLMEEERNRTKANFYSIIVSYDKTSTEQTLENLKRQSNSNYFAKSKNLVISVESN